MNDKILKHYGTPRHSGRYPWGSGKNPQRNKNFLSRANDLKKQGLTDKEIADAMNMSTTKYRAMHSIAVNEQKKENIAKVMKLHDKGYSNAAISRETGFPESTIRNYLKPEYQARRDTATLIADTLKEEVDKRRYLDVGEGVESQLGCTKEQMKTAIAILESQGYKYHRVGVRQVTDPSKELNVVVLTKDDVPYSEVKANLQKISSPKGIKFEDYAEKVKHMGTPKSISSDRIKIRYGDEVGADGATGEQKDGVIEIREGVADLDIGKSRYAQVRIAVDGTHYLKGMAMYADPKTMPDGVDIIFNTNKSKDIPMISEDKDHSVLKPMKDDPENPFGASIKDQRGALNIVNEDEDWEKWSKTLSSQFLSKQPPVLAKQQLDKTYNDRYKEFKDIQALTNPVIKRKLLEEFADECDSAAVHLKATAFPRQAAHVILPINSLKDNEIYAPNYNDGEEVVLIRYPHAGVFEIPRLRVNNQNPEGRALLQNAKTAVGINAQVAAVLSGADFDGDTVTVIPTKGLNIRTSQPLEGLKEFNPSREFEAYEGMPRVGPKTGFHKQQEMGKVSNLITDMTIQSAPPKDIEKAVKHSMVVIDAEKHNLDWRRSARENDIAGLKREYQGGANRGASTLVSRSKSVEYVNDRKEYKTFNKMTPEEQERYLNGEKIFRETGKTKINKKGKEELRKNKSTKMYETNDARTLSSGTLIEDIYADYANKTKALGNEARKELRSTERLKISSTAKKVYAAERASLISQLNIAKKNAPLERQAQLIASVKSKARIEANGITDRDDIKKIRQQELKRARDSIGTRPRNPTKENSLSIKITDREWEAIQAGAISDTTLTEILRYTDTDALRQRATPKATGTTLSDASVSRARNLLNNGYTQSQVAKALGVSVSTLNRALEL
jgi:lambda repressor-like predicted transcriptional regulator